MTFKPTFDNSLSVHKGWLKMLTFATAESQLTSRVVIRNHKNSDDRCHLHDLRKELEKMCEITNDLLMPIKIAKYVEPLTFGSYSLALWASPNMEYLLKNTAEFSIVAGSPIRLQYHEDKQGNAELWVLDSEPFNQDSHVSYLGITLFIATIIFIIRKTTYNDDIPIAIKLINHKFSPSINAQIEHLTNTKITDGEPVRKICIDKKYLYKPFENYDEEVYFATLNLLRKETEKLKKQDLILQIYNALNHTERLEHLSGKSLAQSLNMNIRTLNRKLSELNTSYRGVVEKYKLEKALHLLDDQTINMTEIAYQLGFADLSTFSRAFKRWTGISPIKMRLQQK